MKTDMAVMIRTFQEWSSIDRIKEKTTNFHGLNYPIGTFDTKSVLEEKLEEHISADMGKVDQQFSVGQRALGTVKPFYD